MIRLTIALALMVVLSTQAQAFGHRRANAQASVNVSVQAPAYVAPAAAVEVRQARHVFHRQAAVRVDFVQQAPVLVQQSVPHYVQRQAFFPSQTFVQTAPAYSYRSYSSNFAAQAPVLLDAGGCSMVSGAVQQSFRAPMYGPCQVQAPAAAQSTTTTTTTTTTSGTVITP